MGTSHDPESGITLVEIMVSLLVLGMVLTAFFTVVTGGLRSLSESRARQTSSQVSTEIIEELRRLAPSQIAMRKDPAGPTPGEYDPAKIPGGCPSGEFDPDGPGPLLCETIVSNALGAIVDTADEPDGEPYFATVDAVDVITVATAADAAGVPPGTVRVTVVMTYELASGSEVVRRSALFSEVSRG